MLLGSTGNYTGTGYEWHPSGAYVDDVNLIGDDIRTIERNAEVLL